MSSGTPSGRVCESADPGMAPVGQEGQSLSETDLVSTDVVNDDAGTPARKRGGLTGMVLAELRQLAGELKIPDTSGMRKGDLIAAIKARQSGSAPVASGAPARAVSAQLSLGDGDGPGSASPAAVSSGDAAPTAVNGTPESGPGSAEAATGGHQQAQAQRVPPRRCAGRRSRRATASPPPRRPGPPSSRSPRTTHPAPRPRPSRRTRRPSRHGDARSGRRVVRRERGRQPPLAAVPPQPRG